VAIAGTFPRPKAPCSYLIWTAILFLGKPFIPLGNVCSESRKSNPEMDSLGCSWHRLTPPDTA